MKIPVRRAQEKLEKIAVHMRELDPSMWWKVFTIEQAGQDPRVLLRGTHDREPKLLGEVGYVDLDSNGDISVCVSLDEPFLVGNLDMKGRTKTLARRFLEIVEEGGKKAQREYHEKMARSPGRGAYIRSSRRDEFLSLIEAIQAGIHETLPGIVFFVDLSAQRKRQFLN